MPMTIRITATSLPPSLPPSPAPPPLFSSSVLLCFPHGGQQTGLTGLPSPSTVAATRGLRPVNGEGGGKVLSSSGGEGDGAQGGKQRLGWGMGAVSAGFVPPSSEASFWFGFGLVWFG